MPHWRRDTWIVLINLAYWVFPGWFLVSAQTDLVSDGVEGAVTRLGLYGVLVIGGALSICSLAYFWSRTRPDRARA